MSAPSTIRVGLLLALTTKGEMRLKPHTPFHRLGLDATASSAPGALLPEQDIPGRGATLLQAAGSVAREPHLSLPIGNCAFFSEEMREGFLCSVQLVQTGR